MAKEVDQVLESEVGNRSPHGVQKIILIGICFLWALFQLWYASPLPFMLNIFVFNDTEARAIHLAFAVLLAFLAFGFSKRSPSHKIPIQDWILGILGTFCALYIFIFYEELSGRSGDPIMMDIIFSLVGIVLLLEVTRRALGLPLVIVASIFLIYSLAGPYMPDTISHRGASLNKLLSHQWLTTEGVFGVALGVSTSFVFLFVLFGALLDRAGAGEYFIRLAYSFMGHMRGGPAKAAVLASGLSGIISGSSISNVVTTGTFTIPLMKKVGFPDYKAGAVEVAASTNGQLTPPVMGAAAFLMVEYVGVSYIEVIKHAILPALISYIALFYIVHLEAVKLNMKGIPHQHRPLLIRITNYVLLFFLLCLLSLIIYYSITWIKMFLGESAPWAIIALLIVTYLVLLYIATPYYGTEEGSKITDLQHLPPVKPTLLSGLHYIFPIIVLLWCLTVERYSPSLSAFYALLTMILITITQKPIIAFFQGKKEEMSTLFKESILKDLFTGMVNGSKNMIGIGIATATAGIVVGTITLTGIGQVMTEFILQISSGNIILTLIFTAVICLLLGMGLPTTANYIVVSSLMAPVIVNIGALSGFVVPLIAVHLFVFYFGILADDTPPVGLAAFAASGIAGSDPIKTGVQGFTYDIRTAILPFMFVFNTQLLLIGIDHILDLVLTVVFAVLAMLTFASATQRFWMVKTKWWEVVALLLVSFTFFRPNFWLDQIQDRYIKYSPDMIYEVVENKKDSEPQHLRMVVEGSSLEGDIIKKTVILELPEEGTAQERVEATGLSLEVSQDESVVNMVIPGSPASLAGIDFDWKIVLIEEEANRISGKLFYIPALLILFLIWVSQKRRMQQQSQDKS